MDWFLRGLIGGVIILSIFNPAVIGRNFAIAVNAYHMERK